LTKENNRIKYGFMRKMLILLILGLFGSLGRAEETTVTPEFRPAKVELTTNGATAPTNAVRPPDGMENDLPVELDTEISLNKIYTYLNDPIKNKPAVGNAMMMYEPKYWNHGAISAKDRAARLGNIFVINWHNDGKPGDFTVRLDYRQAMTREKVMTKTQAYKDFDGYEKTVLKVAGEDYTKGGVVNSWRISIVRDGKIVAEEKSFIW
jgi:hypothetical protein